jgi:hypothetical protein
VTFKDSALLLLPAILLTDLQVSGNHRSQPALRGKTWTDLPT